MTGRPSEQERREEKKGKAGGRKRDAKDKRNECWGCVCLLSARHRFQRTHSLPRQQTLRSTPDRQSAAVVPHQDAESNYSEQQQKKAEKEITM